MWLEAAATHDDKAGIVPARASAMMTTSITTSFKHFLAFCLLQPGQARV